MSNRSQRRRQRKSKQRNKTGAQNASTRPYTDKFSIMEEKNIMNVVIRGYIRESIESFNGIIPLEVEQLCVSYFGIDESIAMQEIDEITPIIAKIQYEEEPSSSTNQYYAYRQRKRNNNLKIIGSALNFDTTFNELSTYKKMLFCKRIMKEKKLPVHYLYVYPQNNVTQNAIFEQLYFVEYILFKRYNMMTNIDLSEIDLHDNHLLYLCNAMQNIIKYRVQKKRQKLVPKQQQMNNKTSRKKPNHSVQNGAKHKHSNINSSKCSSTKTTPQYSRDKRVQKEIERQLHKMEESQADQEVKLKMKLKTLNLSSNNITDKHISLLLRTIKKNLTHMKLELLDLSSTKITNKSLSTIMKYNIKGLRIDLSNCAGVNVRGLRKYQRTDYVDETPLKYVYCENMVYFVNEQEEQRGFNDKIKGGKRVRGKGKKFRANRKRILYTGQDGQETGYLSMEDFWSYA